MLAMPVHITPPHPEYAAIVASITPINRVHNHSFKHTRIFGDIGPRTSMRHEDLNKHRG